MKLTPGFFISTQILLLLFTECMLVKGAQTLRAKRLSRIQQISIHRKHPTNRKKVVLMCFNKNYLVVEKGRLKGTVNSSKVKEFGKFELQSFGVGIVRILNMRTRKYIAFNKEGRVYMTRGNTKDTLFHESQRNNHFVTFHSLELRSLANGVMRKWFLALKKNGKVKRPSKTFARQRSTEFLPRGWGGYKRQLMSSR
ncbi:fibroblast growth factor 1-like [Dendronephthya gigantea]|uniref:fibroblast growth factor 1-like n=1 Tax=Dendronephthya gigantea TaxID=151771 RepID=UPI00106AD1A5|nr:fibroblast growth factor 1-like [Dendronephthya gigantea]XP_028409098.1 fibroblast growth factor 1-like [Dendronephthya gigantea]